MLDKKGCNNNIISKMFEEIKTNHVLEAYKDVKDVTIVDNEERVYQFKSGILKYEQFKLTLSIPSDQVDRSDCLGTYINVVIPQYDSIGVLFVPKENGKFKYMLTGGYKSEYFNKIEINNDYTYEECIDMAKQIIDLFLKAFLMRQQLIERVIKLKYKNIEEDIAFQRIEIEFTPPITKNRNSYLFYYSKNLKTVFFNDIFKTNYKSVINGIETIATQIVKNLKIDSEKTKWVNIFININNSGIIFQEMKLKRKIHIDKANIFSKILFNAFDKEEFISYNNVEFNTEQYMSIEDVIRVWNNILV